MNFNQMKSMRPGGNMNQPGISHTQFTVGKSRTSNVRMDASIAISGDGPVEGMSDYMD